VITKKKNQAKKKDSRTLIVKDTDQMTAIEIVRYSAQTLQKELGKSFQLE